MTSKWLGWLAVAMVGCGGSSSSPDAAVADGPPAGDAQIDAPPPRPLPDLRFKYASAFFPGYAIATEQGADGSEVSVSPYPVAPALTYAPETEEYLSVFFAPDVPVDAVTGSFEEYSRPGHEAALAELAGSGVLTSLDYRGSSYTATSLQADTRTYDLVVATSNPGALGSDVAAQASTGHICTALSATGSGSDVALYCYADPSSPLAYEEVAVIAAEAEVGEQAALLAGSGYTVTALGRANPADRSYALVGTRIANTMEPLGLLVVYAEAGDALIDALNAGYVPMGGYVGSDGHAAYLFQL